MSVVSKNLRESAGHHAAQCLWRPVVGYELAYEVSSDGRVRSVERVVVCSNGKRRRCKAQELQKRMCAGGHLIVQLSRGGATYTALVHRLVAHAFLPGAGPVVRHLDGCPSNNTCSNLAWGTQKQNMADKRLHGTMVQGERHHSSVLTEADVLQIRAMHAKGKTQLAISRELGFGRNAVGFVVRGTTWRHVA